jgi:hypothetical protein
MTRAKATNTVWRLTSRFGRCFCLVYPVLAALSIFVAPPAGWIALATGESLPEKETAKEVSELVTCSSHIRRAARKRRDARSIVDSSPVRARRISRPVPCRVDRGDRNINGVDAHLRC